MAGGGDFVFHETAKTGVRTSVESPQKHNSVNVDGTLNVLDVARDSDVDRVIVASSSPVYGKADYLHYDKRHPTTPVNSNGVSKLVAEQHTRI